VFCPCLSGAVLISLDAQYRSGFTSVTIFIKTVIEVKQCQRHFQNMRRKRSGRGYAKRGKKLFERQGLKKTSVDELAQAGGISKGALKSKGFLWMLSWHIRSWV
jgi:hypothetical protein